MNGTGKKSSPRSCPSTPRKNDIGLCWPRGNWQLRPRLKVIQKGLRRGWVRKGFINQRIPVADMDEVNTSRRACSNCFYEEAMRAAHGTPLYT